LPVLSAPPAPPSAEARVAKSALKTNTPVSALAHNKTARVVPRGPTERKFMRAPNLVQQRLRGC
jgi:hypothetical protein